MLQEIFARAMERVDGWLNTVTGVGTNYRRTAFAFESDGRLADPALAALFRSDAYAARICYAVPGAALRQGLTVKCGDDPAIGTGIGTRLDDLGARAGLTETWTWARLFGGALMFVGADDDQDPEKPLNWGAIKSVRFLTVVDKRYAQPRTYVTNPLDPRFNKPETYRFARNGVGGGHDGRVVHHSRIIRFDGALTDDERKVANNGWSDSELQRVFAELQQFRGAYAAAGALLQDASQGVLKLKNLFASIVADKQDILKKRLELMELSRSVGRSIMIDMEEDFSRVESGVLGGVPAVVDKFMLLLAGAAEMPVTVLMGQSPAGMNATGESDITIWYDRIRADQTNVLKPRAERLVRMLLCAKDGPTGGVEPASWSVQFPSLWQPTPSQEQDLRNKQAQTDQIYLTAQVITPEEVATSRFRPEGWSAETSVNLEAREAALEAEAAHAALGATGGTAAETETDAADPEGVMAVLERVGSRAIARSAGIGVLVTQFGLSPDAAEQVMGETGRTHFTTPDPASARELDDLRAQHAALERSARGTKQILARVLERNRNGELVLGNVIAAKPTEVSPGDVLEEGDVVAVPTNGAPAQDAAKAPRFDFRADAAGSRGVAIMLVVPVDVAAQVAVPDGELAGDLHVTLAYLGTVDAFDDEQRAVLRAVTRAWAARTPALAATLGAQGRFLPPDGPTDPVYLAPQDCPDLYVAREDLVCALASVGVTEPEAFREYTPHVTVAYVAKGATAPTAPAAPVPVVFATAGLWLGAAREAFALTGGTVE
jgi:phage-related protein (TIGR01555 family)